MRGFFMQFFPIFRKHFQIPVVIDTEELVILETMKIKEITVELIEADEGKILEVFHDGETEPVYYRSIYSFCLTGLDVVNEVDDPSS